MSSGFHQALFNVDDFLCAVSAGHFRSDIMHSLPVSNLVTRSRLIAVGAKRGSEFVKRTAAAAHSDTEQDVAFAPASLPANHTPALLDDVTIAAAGENVP